MMNAVRPAHSSKPDPSEPWPHGHHLYRVEQDDSLLLQRRLYEFIGREP